MKFLTNRVRGMQDLLPIESKKWEYVQKIMKDCAMLCGFEIIRTPILEFTELFERSVGGESDIVQKEMYTFTDKSGRSLTMRPECTAGTLRAVLEGMDQSYLPIKVMYFGSCYRYERPQSGRFREFFQFGVENFGSISPLSDAELIFMADYIFRKLKISDCNLQINAIGCLECRSIYNNLILSYFRDNKSCLCDICLTRLEKNPLRIFDCKSLECKKVCVEAPKTIDNICEKCIEFFDEFKLFLNTMKIDYIINPLIVRGLDYYTKLVFEFVINQNDGSEITICGGGRYDGLARIMGAKDLSATGFGMGIERIVSLVDFSKIFDEKFEFCLCIILVNDVAKFIALKITSDLRRNGIKVIFEIVDYSIKTQLRNSNKQKNLYSVVLGDEEVNSNQAKIKNMLTGDVVLVNLDESFINFFINKKMNFKSY